MDVDTDENKLVLSEFSVGNYCWQNKNYDKMSLNDWNVNENSSIFMVNNNLQLMTCRRLVILLV